MLRSITSNGVSATVHIFGSHAMLLLGSLVGCPSPRPSSPPRATVAEEGASLLSPPVGASAAGVLGFPSPRPSSPPRATVAEEGASLLGPPVGASAARVTRQRRVGLLGMCSACEGPCWALTERLGCQGGDGLSGVGAHQNARRHDEERRQVPKD